MFHHTIKCFVSAVVNEDCFKIIIKKFHNLCTRYPYFHMRICTCHAPCAMDSSAMDSSAMESSSVDSSSVDSSAVDSSAREAALRKRRERDRDRRAGESSEQREARLSRRKLADRERARARRGSETATQREVRLARRRIADRSIYIGVFLSLSQ